MWLCWESAATRYLSEKGWKTCLHPGSCRVAVADGIRYLNAKEALDESGASRNLPEQNGSRDGLRYGSIDLWLQRFGSTGIRVGPVLMVHAISI